MKGAWGVAYICGSSAALPGPIRWGKTVEVELIVAGVLSVKVWSLVGGPTDTLSALACCRLQPVVWWRLDAISW